MLKLFLKYVTIMWPDICKIFSRLICDIHNNLHIKLKEILQMVFLMFLHYSSILIILNLQKLFQKTMCPYFAFHHVVSWFSYNFNISFCYTQFSLNTYITNTHYYKLYILLFMVNQCSPVFCFQSRRVGSVANKPRVRTQNIN